MGSISLADMDKPRRMANYMRPGDLNDEGCINLAREILAGAAQSLAHAARQVAEWPSEQNYDCMAVARRFYDSDWFRILSCGVIDGPTAAKTIIKDALRGVRIREEER